MKSILNGLCPRAGLQRQEYLRDNTGGPRGQLAAHPAAAQFILDNAEPRFLKWMMAVFGVFCFDVAWPF